MKRVFQQKIRNVAWFVILMISMAGCSKSQNNTPSVTAQLLGHWKFVGFISPQNDTTNVSIHTDCDSCMSLFISSPNKYYGRSYLNDFGRDAYTNGNKLVLKPLPPNTFDITFPENGDLETKFMNGVHSPNIWEIKNKYLILTTTSYSDTLLFVAQ